MNIDKYKNNVLNTSDFLKSYLFETLKIHKQKEIPKIAFLTGTGLEKSTNSMNIYDSLKYSEIPNFPVSTAKSHRGELCFGEIDGKPIMVMQGRFHLYEGYTPLEVTFPIRVMQEFGIKYIIISNAAGGLNLNFSTGDVMLITDHINLTGHNPLIGKNVDAWGIRFPDMTEVYDKELSNKIFDYAKSQSIPIQKGVYAGLLGPSLETSAETRFLKTIGADAVGFSTVMEATAAVHAGMKIIGLAAITNINNPDAPEKAAIEDIIETAGKSACYIDTILKYIMPIS